MKYISNYKDLVEDLCVTLLVYKDTHVCVIFCVARERFARNLVTSFCSTDWLAIILLILFIYIIY